MSQPRDYAAEQLAAIETKRAAYAEEVERIAVHFRLLEALNRATGGLDPTAINQESAYRLGTAIHYRFPGLKDQVFAPYTRQTITDLLTAFPPRELVKATKGHNVRFVPEPAANEQAEDSLQGVLVRVNLDHQAMGGQSVTATWYTRVAGLDVDLNVTVPLWAASVGTHQAEFSSKSNDPGGRYRNVTFDPHHDASVQRYAATVRGGPVSFLLYYPFGTETESWTPGEWARMLYRFEEPYEPGRVDCPACGESLAWDMAWVATGDVCKHCRYPGPSN